MQSWKVFLMELLQRKLLRHRLITLCSTRPLLVASSPCIFSMANTNHHYSIVEEFAYHIVKESQQCRTTEIFKPIGGNFDLLLAQASFRMLSDTLMGTRI